VKPLDPQTLKPHTYAEQDGETYAMGGGGHREAGAGPAVCTLSRLNKGETLNGGGPSALVVLCLRWELAMWTVSYRGIWQLHLAETAASLVGSAPLVPGFYRARLHLGAI
jgi:hypothetical protein